MAHRYQDRPFRDGDDYGYDDHRASGPAEPDPLAELARLIGQTDPFADIKRSAPPPSPADDPVDHFEPLPPGEDDAPAGPPSWIQRRMVQADPPQDVEATPHPVLRRAAVYPDNEPPVQTHQPESYYQDAPDRYDDVLFGRLPEDQGVHAYEDQFPRETYAEAPFGYQDGYGAEEDEPAPRRRGRMATVVAVLALAVVGTGAAYGYRTYVGTARSGAPPIIKADTEPNKIIPQTAGTGDAVGKLIQDRMSAENGTEQMVSREEQPIDVKEAAASSPRVVFPPLNQNTNPPSPASVAPNIRPPATVANAPASAGDEPRKVRTLTVRGDQADLAAAAVARPASQAAPVATRHAPPAAAAPGANGPLALSPQAESRTRVASTNPSQQAPAASTGGYVVQVSSQRNEAEAQASFRLLQGKFPSMLGSRSPLIKRADLGAKGVYYRTMVGPFGSSEEASRFCGSLKSAGGQCVVQRN
jgi:hypothetical protein